MAYLYRVIEPTGKVRVLDENNRTAEVEKM